jgi:AraC-like DNA-binding protein
MLSDPLISSAVLRGLEDFLKQRNIAYEEILVSAGATRREVDCAPQAGLQLSTILRILDLAALTAHSPCFGLEWSQAFDPRELGVFGYLLQNSGSIREALDAITRYYSLVIHPVSVEIVEEGAATALIWRLTPRLQYKSAQFVLFATGVAVANLRTAAGGSWDPLLVELACPELPCKALLRTVFGPSVHLGAKATRIIVTADNIDGRNQTADPRLFGLLQGLADRMVQERGTNLAYTYLVRRIVSRRIGHGEVSLEAVAHEMQTSPRMLQSHLATEANSFVRLVQTTKQELAKDYLCETDLPLNEIAQLLGFSELSAFSRASHRWFGEPPSVVRDRSRQGRLEIGQGSILREGGIKA